MATSWSIESTHVITMQVHTQEFTIILECKCVEPRMLVRAGTAPRRLNGKVLLYALLAYPIGTLYSNYSYSVGGLAVNGPLRDCEWT